MANETTITLVGNLTADPELRYTSNGTPVANFVVASTARNFDRDAGRWVDGDTVFLRCTAWRSLAEHTAGCLAKGARMIVTGRLRQRSFHTPGGEERTVTELDVDEAGPSLRYGTTTFTKAA